MEIIKNNIKQMTINTLNEAPLESMIGNALFIGKSLCWCNGILFSFEPVLPTSTSVENQLNGAVHFASLTWCTLKEYESTLDDGNNQQVPVLNLDHHAFWKEILANV